MSKVVFYDSDSHKLRTDSDTLSSYWSVRGEHMTFTYFEVPPNTEFKSHKHLSEQITYVLGGELNFEMITAEVYCLRKGDCIVIPSNVEHRVWTTSSGARAIDAWSPPNDS